MNQMMTMMATVGVIQTKPRVVELMLQTQMMPHSMVMVMESVTVMMMSMMPRFYYSMIVRQLRYLSILRCLSSSQLQLAGM